MSDCLNIYFSKIKDNRSLSNEEEMSLFLRLRNGDKKALKRIIEANLRFVVSVAKNYENQGLPLGDLIEEGNIGLLKATGRFDPTKNFRFISYAVWWIRQSILTALAEHSRVVKIPLHTVGDIQKFRSIQEELERKNGRPGSHDEVITALIDKTGKGEDSYKDFHMIVSPAIYLDGPLGDDGNASILDSLPSPFEDPCPDSSDKLLKELDNRSRIIVSMYFGLPCDLISDGIQNVPHNLKHIGNYLGLSRERIRQLLERALGELRRKILRGGRIYGC
jgi:RNA polymerase primary sigma factor